MTIGIKKTVMILFAAVLWTGFHHAGILAKGIIPYHYTDKGCPSPVGNVLSRGDIFKFNMGCKLVPRATVTVECIEAGQ